MTAMPAVGSPAPDFTLPSTSGASVTLSELRGKNVLLAFFPLAFTRVCTTELCSFSAELNQFETANTVVLPVSVDSIPALRAFQAQEHINLDLLSDFKREVSRLYGTLIEEKFHSNRSYILIDRQGIVRWTHAESSTGNRRENAELIGQIQKLH